MTGLCLSNMRVRSPIPLSFSLAISKEHQRRRKVIYGTAPGLPEVRNQTDILYVFQDGSVKFPQTWTGRNDVRDRDRDLDSAEIWKRTGHHGAGWDGRDPQRRNADKVDARGKGTVPFCPHEPGSRRVQVPENVNDTTLVEEATKGRSTLVRWVRWVRATPIQSSVENRVKVTTQQRGNRKVDFCLKIVQKMVLGRITIWDLHHTPVEDYKIYSSNSAIA